MYEQKIKSLELSFRNIENSIHQLHQTPGNNDGRLKQLNEDKNKIVSELRELRRKQYEQQQYVEFDDDR